MAGRGYIKIEGNPHKQFVTSLQIVWVRDKKVRANLLELDYKLRLR